MNLPLKIIGVSHKTANIRSRELFDFKISKFNEFLNARLGSEIEFSNISTCNRSEVIISSAHIESSLRNEELLDFFEGVEGVYIKDDREAIRHFFSVCSGLDSLVLGESQIFGQVKMAYKVSSNEGTVGPVLHRLFQESFRVAKKLRSNTSIGRGSLSVASLAVMQAVRIFGSLSDRKALVVGAGETGALVSKILRQHDIDKLFICNRTYEKTIDLCEQVDAIPLPLDKFNSVIGLVDIIVVAIAIKDGSSIIDKFALSEKIGNLGDSPICILDLSVPRMVDREIESLDSVYSFCIDDLSPLVDENLKLRQIEALRAEAMIEEEINSIVHWNTSREGASQIAKAGDSLLGDSSLINNLKLSEYEFRVLVKKSLNGFFERLRNSGNSSNPITHSHGLIRKEILEALNLKIKS